MLAQTLSPLKNSTHYAPRDSFLTRSVRPTWSQRWLDVLFLHWPIAHQEIAPQLPSGVELDCFGGAAWVSVVLFRLDVRLFGLPAVPGFSALTEINYRTYVRCNGKAGIYFLSMHADNVWAIRVARALTPLPYVYSAIGYQQADGVHCVRCPRLVGTSQPFTMEFRPNGEEGVAAPDSLDEWLLERYVAFVPDRRGRVFEAEVSHAPWRVQPIQITGPVDAAYGPAQTVFPAAMHYSTGVSALFGRFAPVGIKLS